MTMVQPLWLRKEDVPELPAGWNVLTTNEACEQLKPGKLYSGKTTSDSGVVPVLSQGESGFVGYHNEDPGVAASPNSPVVTFANHTCAMRLMTYPYSCIQNIFSKVGKEGVCDTKYFYYAAMGRVTIGDYKGHHPIFRQAYIPIPPIKTQHRIASALSAYDDLIENNTRRIVILEEMTRRLYEEWFTHFRFPGHESVGLKNSELGKIPQTWDIASVGDAVERFTTGKKYSQKTVLPTGDVPVLDQGKQGVIGYHNEKPGFWASPNDPVIMFANHTCYQRLIFQPFSSIQNVIPYKSSDKFKRNIYWLFHATEGLVELNDYKGHWPQFAAKRIPVAESKVADSFGELVKPLHHLIRLLQRKNANLRNQRDLLLPKLVSGEIDTSDIPLPVEAPSKAA